MNVDCFSKAGNYYANEDSLCVCKLAANQVVVVLADGMGGLSLGKLAADLIVNAIAEYVKTNLNQSSIQDLIGNALKHADQIIRLKSKETRSKMGASIALAFIDGKTLYFTWLGNVRIYLYEESRVKLLTTDHSLDVGYGKQALTRCIKGNGIRPDWPYQEMAVQKGTKLILCTDGLYRQFEIKQLFTTEVPLHEEFEDDASMIRIEI